MRYLGIALFAEGASDHRFLSPLLTRLCIDTCLDASCPVEIGRMIELHSPEDLRKSSREERIYAAARESAAAWDLLFVHTDGAGDAQKARADRIDRAARLIADDLEIRGQAVPVVPVRETEAWALSDVRALSLAFGCLDPKQPSEVPTRPRDVERVLDPKACLRKAFESLVGRSKRRDAVAGYLEMLAAKISFERLQQVPSFAKLRTDLVVTLAELGIKGPREP